MTDFKSMESKRPEPNNIQLISRHVPLVIMRAGNGGLAIVDDKKDKKDLKLAADFMHSLRTSTYIGDWDSDNHPVDIFDVAPGDLLSEEKSYSISDKVKLCEHTISMCLLFGSHVAKGQPLHISIESTPVLGNQDREWQSAFFKTKISDIKNLGDMVASDGTHFGATFEQVVARMLETPRANRPANKTQDTAFLDNSWFAPNTLAA